MAVPVGAIPVPDRAPARGDGTATGKPAVDAMAILPAAAAPLAAPGTITAADCVGVLQPPLGARTPFGPGRPPLRPLLTLPVAVAARVFDWSSPTETPETPTEGATAAAAAFKAFANCCWASCCLRALAMRACLCCTLKSGVGGKPMAAGVAVEPGAAGTTVPPGLAFFAANGEDEIGRRFDCALTKALVEPGVPAALGDGTPGAGVSTAVTTAAFGGRGRRPPFVKAAPIPAGPDCSEEPGLLIALCLRSLPDMPAALSPDRAP
jgi:hypothetical protein